ncbi:hypothetical protein CIHG_08834 [Coccidioides immitis H538.4]|uniref:Uncharacterized protein n=2 Tax=Coccidioides immitis TaxID=5501 RepID=A0A0J8UTC1_COCIT|nr:hypothetical protein CIRG_04729 [Coccidioides immitis RMSCC 2394]KMU90978.1 hypothetical protein CIHG_08834 [Coccidioides immitis H538.4]
MKITRHRSSTATSSLALDGGHFSAKGQGGFVGALVRWRWRRGACVGVLYPAGNGARIDEQIYDSVAVPPCRVYSGEEPCARPRTRVQNTPIGAGRLLSDRKEERTLYSVLRMEARQKELIQGCVAGQQRLQPGQS